MQVESLPDPTAEVIASVRQWISAWGAEVAAVDLTGARHRFDRGVVSFGTYATAVNGIDELHDQQWSNVWPEIANFSFRLDDLAVLASPDGRLAVAVTPWDSTSIGTDGSPHDRPGRATVVLARKATDSPWVGVHTHFSLAPSVDGNGADG